MKFSKKSLILLASLLLAVCLTVGGTLAFLVATDGPLPNTFTPSQVTTSVTETNKDGVKTNVKIQNTGDTEAYIRAAIIVTWQNDKGEVYGKAPTTADYEMEIGDSWDEGPDGFYYHKAPVAAGASTDALITEAKPKKSDGNTEANAAGYYLNIEIIGSGIQSKPTKVVVDNWGVSLAADGKSISK